jgi:hypothetical protein
VQEKTMNTTTEQDVVGMAERMGITITSNNDKWRAEFGTEHLLTTNNLSSLQRFLDECELVESAEFLSLRISGFLEHCRAKTHV